MRVLVIIAIVIGSLLVYVTVAGLFWGIMIRTTEAKDKRAGVRLADSESLDSSDWALIAGFWPVAIPLFTLCVLGNSTWIIISKLFMFVGNRVTGFVKPSAPKPIIVVCDICRKKMNKGTYR